MIQIAALALVLATTSVQGPTAPTKQAAPLSQTPPTKQTPPPKLDAAPKPDAAAESASSLARLAPKDAFFLLQARNLDALRADFEAGAWYGLYQDDEVKGLRGWFEDALRKAKDAKASKEGGSALDPWELARSVHGSAASFGVIHKGEKEPVIGVLVDPGEPRGPFEDLAAKFLDERKHEPGTVETTEEYAGVELRTFETTSAKKAEKADPKKPKEDDEESEADDEPAADAEKKAGYFVYFETGGVAAFVLSEERERLLETVHGIVDRASGKDPSGGVEGAPSLSQARASVAKPGRIECFVDLAAVMEIAKAEKYSKEEEQKILSILGVDDLRWLYGSADLGKGENVAVDLSVKIPEKGYVHDWIGLLGKAPKEFAALAPRDSSAVSIANFDLFGLWQSAWKFSTELNEEGTQQARSEMEAGLAQVGAGDLEKSLLSQIDGRFLSFNVAIPEVEWKAQMPQAMQSSLGQSSGDATVGHQGSAMVFGLREVQTVSRFVEEVLKGVGVFDSVKSEDFQGNQLHEFSPGPGPGIHWGFLKQGIVISQSPTAIRAAFRMETAERKDSALEKEAFKPLYDAHADAGVLGLATTADSLKAGLAAVQAMRTVAMMAARGGGLEDSPLAHLPSAGAIDRHFKGTTATTVSRAGGVLHLQLSCN